MKILNNQEFETLLKLPILIYILFLVIFFFATITERVWMHSMEIYFARLAELLLKLLPLILYNYIIFIISGIPIYVFLKKLNWHNFVSIYLFSFFPAIASVFIALYFSKNYDSIVDSEFFAVLSFSVYQAYALIFWLRSDVRRLRRSSDGE